MSWQTATLGKLCDVYGGFVQTGPFGSQLKQSEYIDDPDGVPVVMPKDIKAGRIDLQSAARISEQKAKSLSRHFLADGDIIFPRRGDINKLAIVEDASSIFCGTGCLRIHTPSLGIVPKFLFYFLGQPKVAEWLEARAIGSTMLNLNTSIMRAVEVRFPDYQSQCRIAAILSAYDDLIENNRRRIALLEETARQLYKEWFVRFRFPGHEHVKIVDGIPEGWERATLGDALTLQRGFDLPTGDRDEGDVPVYGSTGIVGYHNVAKVGAPMIVTGRSGSLGQVCFVSVPCWPLNTALWVKDLKRVSPWFAYFLLADIGLEKFNGGASVPTLDRKVAHAAEIIIPPQKWIDSFDEVSQLNFKMIENLKSQTANLTKARDLLLPRLMNGSLTV